MLGFLSSLFGGASPMAMLAHAGPFGAALSSMMGGAGGAGAAMQPPPVAGMPTPAMAGPGGIPSSVAAGSGFQPSGLGNYKQATVQTTTPPPPVAAANPTSQVPDPNTDLMGRAQNSIGQMESSNNYGALGKVTKNGDRAYGRYQVMGNNVGPWTKQWTGTAMTPAQFLKDQAAQDAVFKGQFGGYAKKYGWQGASHAWFAGEKGMKNLNATDLNKMSVANYGNKFMQGFGQAPQVQTADMTSPSSVSNPTAVTVPAGGTVDTAVASNSLPDPTNPDQMSNFLDQLLNAKSQPVQTPPLTPGQEPPPTDLGAQEVAANTQALTQNSKNWAQQRSQQRKMERQQSQQQSKRYTI